MPGRRPILATLLSDFLTGIRDLLFKATLEPKSPQERKEKENKKNS